MLTISELSYLYNQKTIDGIHNLSLNIKKGEIVGLMGPSGHGKSTLAKIINGELNPQKGVLCNDFQKTLYLSESLIDEEKTVLENLMAHAHGDTADQKLTKSRMACSDLEITNFINAPFLELSMGQKQRMLLGIFLVSGADFIIMDEPFSHLEAPLKEELVATLLTIIKEKQATLLWISHDQKLMMSHCHKIIMLHYGKIQQIDSPENLYFFPENLFVANFFGPYNIDILSHEKSLLWNFSFPSSHQAIIYRPEAITVSLSPPDNDMAITAICQKECFEGGSYLYEFKTPAKYILKVRSLTKLQLKTDYYLKLNHKLIKLLEEI